MAKAKTKPKTNKTTRDNTRGSVTETPGITVGRARTEQRIGSGNRRSGAVDAKKAAGREKKPSR